MSATKNIMLESSQFDDYEPVRCTNISEPPNNINNTTADLYQLGAKGTSNINAMKKKKKMQ